MKSNLIVRGGADFSGFKRELSKAQTNLKGFQNQTSTISKSCLKMGDMIKSAFIVAGVGALIGFGKQAIKLSSDIREVQNVVDTAFGSMAIKMEQFADTAIETYGISKLTAKKTGSVYMAMGAGMNIVQEKASDMAVTLTGLSADISSFFNVSQDVSSTALKSIYTGETETLKQFGIVMTQVNLQEYARQQGITKSIDKMTQQQKVMLRYNYVLNATKMAQGDFAKTSGGWANQTRILSERWKEFSSIVGNLLINVLLPCLNAINHAMSGLISVSTSVSKAFSFNQIQSSTKGIVNDTQTASDNMGDISNNGKSTAKAIKSITGFDELNTLDKPTTEGSTGSSDIANITPIGDITPKINEQNIKKSVSSIEKLFLKLRDTLSVLFNPTLNVWRKAFDSLKQPLNDTFNNISLSAENLWNNTLAPFAGYLLGDFLPSIVNSFSHTFAPIFSDVMSFAISEFSKDFEFVCLNIEKFTKDIFLPIMQRAKVVTSDVMNVIKNEWSKSSEALISNLTRLKDSFKEIWFNIYDNILKPVMDNIYNAIDWLWDRHLRKLWENVVSFTSKLGECVMTIWNNFLAPLVNWLVKTFGPTLVNVFNGVIKIVNTIAGVIADVVGGVLKALGGLLDFITGVFSGNWSKAWNGIKNIFIGIWEAVWGVIKGIMNLIIGGINRLWSGIYKAVKGIVDGIGGIAGALGSVFGQSWSFKMPANPPLIPKLATGTVVPANYGEFMAILGDNTKEPEVVSPLSTMKQAFKEALNEQGGGNTQPTTIVLKVGTTEFARTIINSINDFTRQTGELAIDLI